MLLRPPALSFFHSALILPYNCRSTSSSSSIMSNERDFTAVSTYSLVEMNKSDGTSNGKQGASVERTPNRRIRVNKDSILKHLGFYKNQQQHNAFSSASHNPSRCLPLTNNISSAKDMNKQATSFTSETIVTSPGQPEHHCIDVDHVIDCSLPAASSGTRGSREKSLKEDEFSLGVECTHMLEEYSLPASFGKREPSSQSRKPKSCKYSQKDGGGGRNKYPKNKSFIPVEVFDIFHSEVDDPDFLRPPRDLLNEPKEALMDQLSDEPRERVLRPGMILLKSYISYSEQVSILKKCRKLGIGPGGFYQPGYKYGAKLRLHMMCLGLDWDPQTRKYLKRRRIDNSKPPDIPPDFRTLVDRAMLDSLSLLKRDFKDSTVEDILPQMSPDVCIINFYTETGRLGLHQDRDESKESLTKGLPVVSFSLGNSAEFLYGDDRDANKAEKLILESGDVLIFGGQSRHVFHGVSSIIPDSAPRALLEETGLRPGRLNLTFRQNTLVPSVLSLK